MAEMVDRDLEHLRLLMMSYYVLAGTTAFFSLFALIYVVLGAFMFSGLIPKDQASNPDPKTIGYIITAIGVAVFLFGIGIAMLYYIVARGLRSHRWRIFCCIMAGLSCLYIPFGTAIGVCTFMVLMRPNVMRLFDTTRETLVEPVSPL